MAEYLLKKRAERPKLQRRFTNADKTTMTQDDKNLLQHIKSLIKLYRSLFRSTDSMLETRKERKNMAGGALSQKEIQEASRSLFSLQRGLTGERALAGSGYMQDKDFLAAYFLYYWPVSYMQISYIARSISSKIKSAAAENKKRKIRILDLGSGPAPASAALLDALKNAGCNSLEADVVLVDSSERALSLAKKILALDFPECSVETSVCDFERSFPNLDGKFDLIVSCHAVNELWKDNAGCIKKRASFLEKAASYLSDFGAMIICEPALLLTSRNLIKVRDMLLQNGLDVISPCARAAGKESAPCPVLKTDNHTCHAEEKWKAPEPVASIAKNAGLDRESIKMTYFVFTKKCASKPAAPDVATDTVQELAPAAGAEKKAGGNSQGGFLSGKIVSEGMLNKAGRVRFLVCDGVSRVAVSAKKDDPHAAQIGFFSLKRYDSVSFSSLEKRSGNGAVSYGVASSTCLKKEDE